MFRVGHPADQPLRVRPELLHRPSADAPFPILREATPVRMDLSHSAWSDIFFLGMDYPEGARVLNISIDLGVRGRDAGPRPPVEAYFRVIDEPLLRLASVDLGATADITHLAEVFDYAKDYLGLLKAAVIAAGLVPPGIEGSEQSLADLLARIVGPGHGIELVSNVNGIPKGSRLAVSTSLLACLIAACMRATGQAHSLTGPLAESERRLVAARALLGEWLAGSGGGWQDSGGLWPGIKLIYGVPAGEGDPEFGISRGRLLPDHRIFGPSEVTPETRQRLQDSLVLVHGGLAQNVGPILEMVTEKYLLRSEAEWLGRQEACSILDQVVAALCDGDVRRIGAVTTRNFAGPIQTIIPWASNLYTERLIERARAAFGEQFWGFWMLGGMSGGGMGFIFDPAVKAAAQDRMPEIMRPAKRQLETAMPFAMEPVVYDFAINERGTWAELLGVGEWESGRMGERENARAGDAAIARSHSPAHPLPRSPAPHAPRLLRHDRAGAAAPRPLAAFAGPPRRPGSLWRGLPHAAGTGRHGADPLRPASAPRPAGGGRQPQPGGDPGRARLRPRAARADPGGPAQRPHRPGAESPAGQHRYPRCAGRGCGGRDGRVGRLGWTSATRCRPGRAGGRRGGGSHPGRRGRQPLDAGRRAWSRRCTRSASSAASIAASSKCIWPRAAASAAWPAGPCRTSSPPAI